MDVSFMPKPHPIRAFRFTDVKLKPPVWFMDAFKVGKVQVISNHKQQHITVYRNDICEKAKIGDWICIDRNDNIFVLTDHKISEDYLMYQEDEKLLAHQSR